QNNVRDAGEGLGVVDDRRSAPQSHDSREGRSNSRHSALALERLHERRLLADLVCSRAAVPVNFEIASAAKDVLAEETLPVGVGDGLLHDFREVPVLTADVNVT